MISQNSLVELANKWEPEASSSPQGFRQSTCVECGQYENTFWHCWIKEGGFKKELHLCWRCGVVYGQREVDTLVVIPTNSGKELLEQCLDSISSLYPILIVDTGSERDYLKEMKEKYQHLTITTTKTPYKGYAPGAYLWAYWNFPAKNYLFLQDSLEILEKDYVKPFKEKDKGGVVAWTLFPILWDSMQQKEWCKYQFNVEPTHGIFGPIFYVSHEALFTLEQRKLLPNIPFTRGQAQGLERAWAMALMEAKLPIEAINPIWNVEAMGNGTFPIFKKIWRKRE